GIGSGDERLGRRTARAHDHARTLVDDILLFQSRVGERLLHGEKIVRRTLAHEAACAAVDGCFKVNLEAPLNLRAKTHAAISFRTRQPRTTLTQGSDHFLRAVADRANNAKPR